MACSYSFAKTSKINLIVKPSVEKQLNQLTEIFNTATSFYLQVFHDHITVVGKSNWLRAAEGLTHRTKNNPDPTYPLDTLLLGLPSGLRRAAIAKAHGLALSWQSNYDNWQVRKVKQESKNLVRATKGRKPIIFKERPPQYPEEIKSWPVYYSTEHKWLDDCHILLKVYTGKTYIYRKVALAKPFLIPEGYVAGSPTLIRKVSGWEAHIPLVLKERVGLKKVAKLVKEPQTKICAIDLGINCHASMTIQDIKGRVYAVKFITGSKDNHLRKRYLEKIVRLQKQTKIIPKGQRFAKDLWNRVSNLNNDIAHRISRQIVDFAQHHGAKIIVFEHLNNLKASKGTKSRRLNQKFNYWVKGRIFRYTQYKGLHQGIVTSRVNPKNTSKRCPYCGMLTIERYNRNKPGVSLARCTNCGVKDLNADFVGTLGIGLKFRLRACA